MSRYAGRMAFLVIYIAEAHASDGWQLGKHVEIKNHTCTADRAAAAELLQQRFGFKAPILLDLMTNDFDSKFAVWPERYFIVQGGRLNFIAEPTNEFGFDLVQLLIKIDFYALKPSQ